MESSGVTAAGLHAILFSCASLSAERQNHGTSLVYGGDAGYSDALANMSALRPSGHWCYRGQDTANAYIAAYHHTPEHWPDGTITG